MIRSKSFIQLVIIVVALTVFFQKGYAKKKVVESGEGYKIIETTKKVKKNVSRWDPQVREVRCSHCGTRIYDLWARVCPSCGYKLGEMYVNDEETNTSVIITTNDASVLKRIICSNPKGYVRSAALSNVINENLLKECVIETQFDGDRERILEKINNLDILKDLKKLLPDNYVVGQRIWDVEFEPIRERRDAVEKTTDPVVLEKYALNDDDPVVREEAALKINDVNILLRILENERTSEKYNWSVYRRIDNKIASMVKGTPENDPEKLKEMALDTPSEQLGQRMVIKLEDKSFLREIALNAKVPAVRAAAACKIQDLMVLLEVLRADSDTEVIHSTLNALDPHISNKKIATEIISILSKIPSLKNEYNEVGAIRVGFKLAKLSGDYGFVFKVLPISNSTGFLDWGEEFISELPDNRILLEIAANERYDDDYRVPAIKKLRDMKEIEKILEQKGLPPEVESRGKERLAELKLENTTDNEVLYSIYQNDQNFWMRKAAIRKMTNRIYLTNIKNDQNADNQLRYAAGERLDALKRKTK